MTWKQSWMIVWIAAVVGCGGAAPPAPPAPAPFPYREVWTRRPGVELRVDSVTTRVLPYLSMRLDVVGADSVSLLVRCAVCTPALSGRVDRGAVVFVPKSPQVAAESEELAEFVLAVRSAAARKDVDALRPVMSRMFVHSYAVGDGVLEALAAWERDELRPIERLPFLLDQGVAAIPYTPVWAAPPAFATRRGYADYRAGFRKERGRWEWVFLARGG